MDIYFDIETVGVTNDFSEKYVEKHVNKGLKDPEKIEKDKEEKRKGLALNPLTGKIILVGFLTENGELHQFTGAEEYILEKTIEYIHIAVNRHDRLISFYGKTFDLSYILQRAVINSIRFKTDLFFKLLSTYQHEQHLDLSYVFPKGKLNEIDYLIGYDSLDDEDGSSIAAYYEAGDMKAILEKNKKDLEKLSHFTI